MMTARNSSSPVGEEGEGDWIDYQDGQRLRLTRHYHSALQLRNEYLFWFVRFSGRVVMAQREQKGTLPLKASIPYHPSRERSEKRVNVA